MAPIDPAEALRILEDELERGTASFAAASTLEELERAHIDILGRKSRLIERRADTEGGRTGIPIGGHDIGAHAAHRH